jgi:uncharacterized membrane protein YeaQ/YmgE (transglycosylase-associated protein family)
MIGTIFWGLIGGTILGYLAKLLLPGRQDIPAWATIGAGVAAALIGGVIAEWIGAGHTRGFDWIKHLIQLLLAIGAIALVTRVIGNSRGRTSRGRA